MQLLSLAMKQKLSRCLNKFRSGTLVLLLGGSYLVGLGGIFVVPNLSGSGASKQAAALQQKVDHLLSSYRMSQSMDMVVKAGAPDKSFGLDLPTARQKDSSLKQAFETEAQATGIALAHARGLSAEQRYKLYHALDEIKPKPDYFPAHGESDADFMLFNPKQAHVMNRPHFQQTLASAREIATIPGNGTGLVLGVIFGPMVLTGIGAFGFCAARRRLDRSIENEEKMIAQAEEDRRQAEALRQAEEAARIAAEEAERKRIAALPPSTRLERDIRVKQLKLAPQKGRRA